MVKHFAENIRLRVAAALIAGVAVGIIPSASAGAAFTWHCGNDSVRIVEILGSLNAVDGEVAAGKSSVGGRLAAAAEMLVDCGGDDYYKTDSIASLRMNVDTFTPMTFANTVLALASAAGEQNPTTLTFEKKLENYSCRRGEDAGFASLMWHSSEWLLDNIYRDNLKEITENYDGARSKIKSLDYMSRHRDEFKALGDEDTFDKVKMLEWGLRNHRMPILPKSAIGRKDVVEDLRDGDILIMVSGSDGVDTYQIGFVKIEPDGAHLIHYDAAKGKVVKELEPLKRYFNLVSKYFSGFRWVRGI